MNKPRPRTSLIEGCSIFCNSDLKYSPNSNERPGKSSSTITSRAANDTAQANGLPPNVEPCEPGVNTSKTSLSAKTTEIGSTPPPSALPKMYTSGLTLSQSVANNLPERPNPACISSAINKILCSSHNSLIAFK
ncbi:Uncharacterised protein [Streptococcus pneumoniae]|nr:Uncharacterised protein [Streptococcus pneumoniae]